MVGVGVTRFNEEGVGVGDEAYVDEGVITGFEILTVGVGVTSRNHTNANY
jgi:hypothetical protein